MPDTLKQEDWTDLLDRIEDGKCTPFLGAGTSAPPLPLGAEIASLFASEHGYPLADSTDLTRVSQYLGVMRDFLVPKDKVSHIVRNSPAPNFSELDEPHAVLAHLPLPLYITTNYDNFLHQALIARGRAPRSEICLWHQSLDPSNRKRRIATPTFANPLIFHLHGSAEHPESLVLTEDDYLDFLVAMGEDRSIIPEFIRMALTQSSVLFLGYRIADPDFRVLFRGLRRSLGNNFGRAHISVQLTPMPGHAQEKQAQEYLDKYFKGLNTRVYWGTVREFAADLMRRWEDRKRAARAQT